MIHIFFQELRCGLQRVGIRRNVEIQSPPDKMLLIVRDIELIGRSCISTYIIRYAGKTIRCSEGWCFNVISPDIVGLRKLERFINQPFQRFVFCNALIAEVNRRIHIGEFNIKPVR